MMDRFFLLDIVLATQSFLMFLLLIVNVYAMCVVKNWFMRTLYVIVFASTTVILFTNFETGLILDPKLWRNISMVALFFALLNIVVSQVRTWTTLQ